MFGLSFVLFCSHFSHKNRKGRHFLPLFDPDQYLVVDHLPDIKPTTYMVKINFHRGI